MANFITGSKVKVRGLGTCKVINDKLPGSGLVLVEDSYGEKHHVNKDQITDTISMNNGGPAAAQPKGEGRMAKLAALAKILKMEGEPSDEETKKALHAKLEGEAVAAMEDDAYGYDDSAAALEEMAKCYEDAHFEEEEGDEPAHVVMRKMAAKFRKLGKSTMGDPPFGGKETPSEEAAEEKAKMEKDGDEKDAKMAAMQATVAALGAKLAKFEASEATRAKAEQDAKERQFEQLADQAIAGGYDKAARGSLIKFARTDFEGAKAAVAHLLPKGGAPAHLFDRMSAQGAPIGKGSDARETGTAPEPRVVQAMGNDFVEVDSPAADFIRAAAQSKDPAVQAKVDGHLTERERPVMFSRLIAAEKVLRVERPDLVKYLR